MHIVLIFLHNLVQEVAYEKQLSGPKLIGVWARGECKNLGPPIYFCNR